MSETLRNALTVDLEEYFQVSNFENVIDRKTWNDLPRRAAHSTHRLLDAFDEAKQRATFFTLGWVAKRHPELVREIADRGHEIACHGYGHALVYDLGPDGFRQDVQRAKGILEDVIGTQVTGYRAPSYSITERSLWALDILHESGFRYDSSIFPIRHHRYGIPGFPKAPVRLELANGGRLDEFPLTTIEVAGLTLPLAGGAYLRFFPQSLFHWGFKRLRDAGRPFVLYTHPWEIDPGQPRQDVSWRIRVNHYHNLGRTEDRIRSLLGAFRFDCMSNVLADLEARGALPGHRIAGDERAAA